MYRDYFIVSILGLIVVLFTNSASRAQVRQSNDPVYIILFQEFLSNLQIENCIQDVPAPTLLREPRYTKGLSNIIKFNLPAFENIPFSADSIKNPFVITLVEGSGLSSPLEFPRPVILQNDSTNSEIIKSLKNGSRYTYTTALFIPVCNIDCDAVTNSNQLVIHCSAYKDTIWSIQDTEAPEIENVRIPELDSTLISGWWNKPVIQIEADLSDPAGVWQGFLYRRNCSSTEWLSVIDDTTFAGVLTDSGYVYSDFARTSFIQNLSDGCYEFRIEGKDATHTPESCFPDFQLAGNGGEPQAGTRAQLKINIDTTPPASVNLSCEQKLDVIQLNWTPSFEIDPGIGLAGYLVYRDDILLETVPAADTTFIDSFSRESQDSEYIYQVQPFDSLGNVQMAGGSAKCNFFTVPQITMFSEPEFTPGDSNKVCWTKSALINSYSVFIAEDCNYESAVMFEVADTCFTFKELVDGKKYCYWISAVDQQQRVILSDTVASTQDASIPEVDYLDVMDAKILHNQIWSTTKYINIKLSVHDKVPGVIRNFQIFENGKSDSLINLSKPYGQIDTTIALLLKSEECLPIAVSAKVQDCAGNVSEFQSVMIYLDETPPNPIADLTCVQMSNANGIKLNWSPSVEPENCSGLAGYRILRNEELIAVVAPDFVTYDDLLPEDTPGQQFKYYVQPFDSLDNLQKEGGLEICDYIGTAQLAINPMPEFTPGLSNEVCWTVSGSLVSVSVFRDDNCDSVADDSVLFINPSQSEMCHLFQNLHDGQRYCYWVSGLDKQHRMVLSDTVTSIQDNMIPVIDSFTFPDGEILNGKIWAYDRQIQLNLIAHDAVPGEIWKYKILENDLPRLQVDFVDSSAQMMEEIPYTLNAPVNQLSSIELSVSVIDGANNVSDVSSITINLQENLTDMFGFPNPFNPLKDRVTIRFKNTSEREVRIYDFFGNLVRVLNEKENRHDFTWDGRNGAGEMAANGGYICIGTETKERFKVGIKKQSY